MKKFTLALVALVAFVSIASAAPRFGVIGTTATSVQDESGLNLADSAGIYITDDMYNAQLTFANQSNDADSKTEGTRINLGGNYKIAVDSVTAITVGASLDMVSGKVNNIDIDKWQTISLNAGIERALSSNLVLTGSASVFFTKYC